MGNTIYRNQSISVKTYPYQVWENYPNSPVLTEDYPYQAVILDAGTAIRLIGASVPLAILEFDRIGMSGAGNYCQYVYSGGAWDSLGSGSNADEILLSSSPVTPYEANGDIYSDTTLAAVYFEATTGKTINFVRARNVRHKGESYVRDKAMRHKSESGWKRVNL